MKMDRFLRAAFVVLICGSFCYGEYGYRLYNSYEVNPAPERSYSNIFGGTDYYSNYGRVRSLPNIHGGYNYYRYYSGPRYSSPSRYSSSRYSNSR